MAIRFATPADIPGLTELGRRMQAISRFRTFDFDEARVKASLALALGEKAERYVILVATDSQQRSVGALMATLERHIFSQQPVASVMMFLVLPEARMGGHAVRLLKALEQWCKNRGIKEINFGINSGEAFAAVGGFAERMGYRMVGANYAKHTA